MNRLLVVANWKANNVDAHTWLTKFSVDSQKLENIAAVEIAIASPFTHLQFLSEILSTSQSSFVSALASQDVSAFPIGAYTGEVPAGILRQLIKYCLVGHSERRKYLQETTEMVGQKINQLISFGVIPIICAQTLEEIPENIKNLDISKYLVMYEPFSAISTDGQYHAESPENVLKTLQEWQPKLPNGTQFLYGGSVNFENILPITNNLISNFPTFCGFVVGHASLDPVEFAKIVSRLCNLPA